MWVLTREINQYDQDGENYVQAYFEKPNEQELLEFVPKSEVKWVLGGGGRRELEQEWFFLRRVK